MLKRFITRFLVVLLALNSVLAAQFLTAHQAFADTPTTPSVTINELMWMGSTASSVDEWIELFNTTSSPIDMSGWQLTNAGSGGTLTIPANETIAANNYFIISNFGLGDSHTIVNTAPDWVTTSVSLSNTCSEIDLLDATLATIDQMGCDTGSKYFAGDNGAVKKSMERISPAADGLQKTSWETSVGFGNLITAAKGEDLASPKLYNDTTAPTVGAVSDTFAVTADTTKLAGSWTGFADIQTGISDYQVGVSTTQDLTGLLAPLQSVGIVSSFTVNNLNLVVGQIYYFVVEATNGVDLASQPAFSNGVTIVNPTTPITNLTATDVPNDNGGSIQLSWSPSIDADHYLVTYYKVGDDANAITINVGAQTSWIVTGLHNAPTTYQFNVVAVATNALSSVAVSITGSAIDNIVPTAAILQAPTVTCNSTTCHVELHWQPGDNSATYYQVGYIVDGVETRTMNLTSMSVILDLAPGKIYTFVVYVFDAAGNQSVASNNVTASLVAPVTAPASKPLVKKAAAVIAPFVPATAQAAEPVVQPNTPVTSTDAASSNGDWMHLVVIAVILLLVALGFYRLSRSLGDEMPNKTGSNKTRSNKAGSSKTTNKASKKPAAASTTKAIEKRKRGRPKGTTKKSPVRPKPTRGRGRPKGSLNKKKP